MGSEYERVLFPFAILECVYAVLNVYIPTSSIHSHMYVNSSLVKFAGFPFQLVYPSMKLHCGLFTSFFQSNRWIFIGHTKLLFVMCRLHCINIFKHYFNLHKISPQNLQTKLRKEQIAIFNKSSILRQQQQINHIAP